jgi:hypothetical protein
VLARARPTGGTALTVRLARRADRPLLVVDPSDPARVPEVRKWIEEHRIRVLNVAGPRAGGGDEVYARAVAFLCRLLRDRETSRRRD